LRLAPEKEEGSKKLSKEETRKTKMTRTGLEKGWWYVSDRTLVMLLHMGICATIAAVQSASLNLSHMTIFRDLKHGLSFPHPLTFSLFPSIICPSQSFHHVTFAILPTWTFILHLKMNESTRWRLTLNSMFGVNT